MTEHDIEERVKSAFTSSVPNILDCILSECSDQKGRVIIMTEVKSKKRIFSWAAGLAAALVLVFAGVFGISLYQANFNVASTVSLDVNPSIEIKTNQKEKVLAVDPLNEDGKIVIGEMNLKGDSIDVAVNALIGSMLRNGYLNEASNSILVSVYGENDENSFALQDKLTREIDEQLKTSEFGGAVLSQIVSPDTDLQALADSYGISLGKARLIRQVIAQEPDRSFEELAGLTINELNLMNKINGISPEDVKVVGNASDKAYIGIDKAKEIAFSHAGVTSESSVSKLEIEMDYEQGIMIYEVSFFYNNYKYNYDINAETGEVTETKISPVEDKGKDDKEVSENKDKLPNDNVNNSVVSEGANSTSNTNSSINVDKAKEIAFSHAGVSSESAVTDLEVETDYEHDIAIYEVSFFYNNYKYNYDINAETGEITEVKSSHVEDKGKDDKDTLPNGNTDNSESVNSTSNTNSIINVNKAKEIAFSHAGVSSESAVTDLEIETDYEHDVAIYEVSFFYNDNKYNYDIDAATGVITEAKSSPADNKSSSGDKNSKSSKSDKSSAKNPDPDLADYIGEAAAKNAALSRAGLDESSIVEYSCETYTQKGAPVYKIKFISGEFEYSCDVNAYTGEIAKFDKEPKHTR